MKKILVTGAGGYIGSVLVPKLLAAGYSVLAVDRFFFGKDNLPRNDRLQVIKDDSRKLTGQLFNDLYIFAETPIQSALYASRLNFNECNGFLSDVIQTVAKKAVITKHEKNHIPNFIHLVSFFW